MGKRHRASGEETQREWGRDAERVGKRHRASGEETRREWRRDTEREEWLVYLTVVNFLTVLTSPSLDISFINSHVVFSTSFQTATSPPTACLTDKEIKIEDFV